MAEAAATIIAEAEPRDVAGIAAFRDRDRLHAALQDELGAEVPRTPRLVQAGPLTISCVAPSRYVVSGPRDSRLAARFARSLEGLAAVTDQSDLWVFLAVSGSQVRETLARLVPVDLRPANFRIGDLALTRAGHLEVRLWRVAEQAYELAVARSYAPDLRYLLR